MNKTVIIKPLNKTLQQNNYLNGLDNGLNGYRKNQSYDKALFGKLYNSI